MTLVAILEDTGNVVATLEDDMKNVVQGDDATFPFELATQRVNSQIQDPFNISVISDAQSKVCWKAGTTKIEKAFDDADVTVTDGTAGKFTALLDDTESATFPKGELGDIEVSIVIGTTTTKFQLLKSWRVIEKICD